MPRTDAAIAGSVVAATLVAELVASLVVDVVVAIDHFDDSGKKDIIVHLVLKSQLLKPIFDPVL